MLGSENEGLQGKIQARQDSRGNGSTTGGRNTTNINFDTSRDIVSGLYRGDRPESAKDQIDVYRRAVAMRARELPLRSLISADSWRNGDRSAGSLADFSVDLETDLSASESAIASALEAAARGEYRSFPFPNPDSGESDEEAPRPIRALEASILRRSQVVLGAPGSGKTTLLSFLAHTLATGNMQRLVGRSAIGQDLLPVFMILRDFAAWISLQGATGRPGASLLWRFFLHDLDERNLGFVADPLSAALVRGDLMLLLDGLDEVPTTLLPSVRESIQDFRKRFPGCRILVSCRTHVYQQPDRQLTGGFFPKTTLLPYDSRHIDQFIGNWYQEVTGDGGTASTSAREKADVLRRLVRRSDLRHLASNPLLLALMALVYTFRGELPDTRTRLYEEAIGALLRLWERDIEVGEPVLTDLLREAGRTSSDLARLLEYLSFEVCAAGDTTSGIAAEEGALIAEIGEQYLTKTLCRLHPKKNLDWAQRVVAMFKLHPGLLVERYPGAFYFFHRSFREYLAAARLAHYQDFPKRAIALLGKDVTWGETIVHAVGILVHNQRDIERPLSLVEGLCLPQAPSEDKGWHKLWLAGEVLLEIGVSRACDTRRGTMALEQIRNRLAALVEGGALQPRERARVGDILGLLGDGRFDRSRFHLPALFRGMREKAIGLVAIKPGPFIMGSRKGDRDQDGNELGNPVEQSIPYRYWIARYPVTVAQFEAFLKAGGYDSAEWWGESGRQWLEKVSRKEPDGWIEQSVFGNRPVVGLSWWETQAYARWLDAHLRRRTRHLPADYVIRLPTEAEWEKVARGPEGRRYAWGDKWEDGRANVAECTGGPVAVGIFRRGETPSGVQDITGNIWEWCLTRYRPYPYRPDDGRNRIDNQGTRVLRGGSWLQGARGVRCACRLGLAPDRSRQDAGFRLVLSVSNAMV